MTGFAPIGAAPLGATAEGTLPLLVTDSAVVSNPEPVYAHLYDDIDSAVVTNPEPTQLSATYVVESAALGDSYDMRSSYRVVDSAQLSETLHPYHLVEHDVLEAGALADTVYPGSTTYLDVSDAAVLNDAVELSVAYVLVADTATLNDAVVVVVTAHQDVLETAALNDAYVYGRVLDVVDAAAANDAVYLRTVGVLNLTDAATLNDSVYAGAGGIEVVTDRAVIVSAEYLSSHGVADITDDGYVDDYVSPLSPTYNTVYTANMTSFAMSTYAGLDFTSAAGDYAGSPRGLFKRNDEYADIELTTGYSDFGAPNLKTVFGVYVDGERAEVMEIDATADVNGAVSTYTYTQMRRSADTQRAVRCDFGRGFRSNYMQLSLRSSGYAKLRSCEPIVAALQRRI